MCKCRWCALSSCRSTARPSRQSRMTHCAFCADGFPATAWGWLHFDYVVGHVQLVSSSEVPARFVQEFNGLLPMQSIYHYHVLALVQELLITLSPKMKSTLDPVAVISTEKNTFIKPDWSLIAGLHKIKRLKAGLLPLAVKRKASIFDLINTNVALYQF